MVNYNNEYNNEENAIKSIEEEIQSWNVYLLIDDMHYAVSLIDDALCYLFEFKVENHKIYYREIQ